MKSCCQSGRNPVDRRTLSRGRHQTHLYCKYMGARHQSWNMVYRQFQRIFPRQGRELPGSCHRDMNEDRCNIYCNRDSGKYGHSIHPCATIGVLISVLPFPLQNSRAATLYGTTVKSQYFGRRQPLSVDSGEDCGLQLQSRSSFQAYDIYPSLDQS